MSTENFETKSYNSHKNHFDTYSASGSSADYAKKWLNSNTADAWRHQRIYQTIEPLIDSVSRGSWLTVGDGRYGLDAQFLASQGCDVIATDISDTLLREAADLNLIKSFSAENAEQLSFNTSQFDYVLCKDAYHHFPRPSKALYEMLRVAKKGVVLIEPSDHKIHGRILDTLQHNIKNFLNRVSGKAPDISKDYEVSGNYVYRISKREIEKVALGLNYPAIAFKGINDYFNEEMLHETIADEGRYYRRAKLVIKLLDILSMLKLRDYRLMVAVLIKEDNDTLMARLKSAGFNVVLLPRNPYI